MFYRTRITVKRVYSGTRSRNQKCSKNCHYDSTRITVRDDFPCGQCGSILTRDIRNQQRSKSGHVFCDQSCAAKYNNAHKKYGARRSKLEVWLEDRLRELYPYLDLYCNRNDAIGMELDFYFPALKLAFEINGIFHYEPIYGGTEGLVERVKKDTQKFERCNESGITLTVIDVYHQKKSNGWFLEKMTGDINLAISLTQSLGGPILSSDPTRGRTSEAISKPTPQPHFRASLALRKAMQWKNEIASGNEWICSIARREKTSHVTIHRILKLNGLPSELKSQLLTLDPKFGFMTVRDALRTI